MRTMKKKFKKIEQTGMVTRPGGRVPDVVLQMPEIFYFDLQKFMNSVRAALNVDFSNRVQLYDMYESCKLDLHLQGVLDKRLRGATRFPIEFQIDGVADDAITPQLRSPWFKQFRRDIVLSKFWGYSLFQFYTDDNNNVRYDLINHKHYDPVKHQLLKYQGDLSGVPIEEFDNMLFVGDERDLGIYVELLVAVLYKRGDMSDWARFCNVFGMPIREYTYEAGDEEARRELIREARSQGSNAVYIHPKDSELRLVESGNKTGSSDLYKTFADYWDAKMSIRILGNTLTTDAQDTGTQALGTVHKDEEDSMNACDRDDILDVLNYYVKPLFRKLGFNIDNGEFVYAQKKEIDVQQQIQVVEKLNAMGLPMDDDYLYETFSVRKPENYDAIKADKEAQKNALRKALETDGKTAIEQPLNDDRQSFKNRLMRFFGIAPQSTGATDF
ncbi:MAG: DUF935 family protein [Bacteroidaceae bacterium]|nr:DUF935 family protein [Bacteroidaceae bacterium]